VQEGMSEMSEIYLRSRTVRYEASQTPDVHQNEECVDQKYGGEREEKVAQSDLKKELKLKGWACCNGQRRWGGRV
jgi:hypothetical protein